MGLTNLRPTRRNAHPESRWHIWWQLETRHARGRRDQTGLAIECPLDDFDCSALFKCAV